MWENIQLSGKTPEATFFKPRIVDLWVLGKILGTHLGYRGSRSLGYRSRTQFTLLPRWSKTRSSNCYKTCTVYFSCNAFHRAKFCRTFVWSCCFGEFCRKISNPFFPSWTFYLPYLWNGWSNGCETKRKWVKWMLRWQGYPWPWPLTFDLDIWPWIFKVKLYLGNGRPDCHRTKGRGVDRMPWSETLRKRVNWTLRWLGYL